MTANKPQEIYHYTTGRCFLGIVADGVIKPATAFAPLGEPPVVWFTFRLCSKISCPFSSTDINAA